MTANDIIQLYFDDYKKKRQENPLHIEDGILSRFEENLPMKPLNEEQTKAVVELICQNEKEDFFKLLLNQVEGGTCGSAKVKANFLKKIALGEKVFKNFSRMDAVNHLSYMKGGYNIPCLVDLLEVEDIAENVVQKLSNLVLIHQNFDRVLDLYKSGNLHAKNLLNLWALGSWYSKRPNLPEETKVIIFKVPDEIEASTDFLSHSKGGHTRTDIPFHGKHYFMNKDLLDELDRIKKENPNIQVAFVADKIGTSSSRKSGMNNVEWNVGIENEDTQFLPNKKTRAIIFAGSVLGPIFGKTASDMGSIILRVNTNLFKTGDIVKINWKSCCILDNEEKVIEHFNNLKSVDFEMIRAGGGTVYRMGKLLTDKARKVLGVKTSLPYQVAQQLNETCPMTAGQKVIAKAANVSSVKPGQIVYAKVDTVASQDTTGPMTVQEIEGTLAATDFAVPLFLQSQCHNAAMGFRTDSVIKNNSKLAGFIKNMGGIALDMGDGIIHSWLNEMVLPDTIVVGGDSHTRVPTALSFPLGSGGIAEAATTGVTEICVPKSVLVKIKGEFCQGITVRDLVNYIPYKALKIYGRNIFEGSLIEFRRIGQPFNMIDVFKLTNSSAERSAAAAYFEMDEEYVANYVKQSSIPVVQRLIEEGYDNNGVLISRLKQLEEFVKNPVKMKADKNAIYEVELEIDLSEIKEPFIACPHTPDNVKSLSNLSGTLVDFGFIGSCMSGKEDFVNFAKIIGQDKLKTEVWAATTTKIVRENLKNELKILEKAGVRIEISGCSLCMGNQERVKGKKNVLTTSTRNFKARMGDEASVFLVSAELEAISVKLGRFPTVEEYFKEISNV
ncbi:MAG: bifunctional aconitate hydratase 2/2-methylisocitrate dehydratase [Alphaproteobacteria bacterium]|nr:bifunctional aconitate hydratase 2/2-methylisocitrate dehydratase [Alphaproteobacteria bacterium]